MKSNRASWRPGAELSTLRARSDFMRRVRGFFEGRGVLEVETPILSRGASVERQIESFCTTDGWWLNTSPEFAMKRLLADGCGPIFQISHVFRAEEQGRLHNPEFTMLEWYRPGWTLDALMDEVEALVATLGGVSRRFERIGYCELIERELGLDPLTAPVERIAAAVAVRGVALPDALSDEDRNDRDFWLDLAMGALLGPGLGQVTPLFVYDYPASQAALARLRPGPRPLAARFELYWRGIELANGFHELADAVEQRARFVADQRWRAERGRVVPPIDEHLLSALAAGLPDCSGVALGLDRLFMRVAGLTSIAESVAFDASRA
jgi:lysyl-tRNA synthetase class 2